MSPFGKNAPKPGESQPPSPPAAGSPGPVGGRKRITQRLVLGGKGAETGEINVGSGLKIPGAPDPVMSQVIPSASQWGTVEVPFASILGYIPAEFVTSDHESLFNSPQAQEMVSLPLGVILPMLPSGKIELLAQDLAEYVPAGTMKSAEELGDYAYSPVALPLQEVISRIPEEAMVLRTDQKPIDASVAQMDEPFSAEMLAAAQEAAAAQTGEQGYDVNELDEPEESPSGSVAAPSGQEEAPIAEEEESEPEEQPGLPEETGQSEQSEPPSQPLSEQQEEEPDVDLSFAQSEEYKNFLAQMESGEDPDGGQSSDEQQPPEEAEAEAPTTEAEGEDVPEEEFQLPETADAAPTAEIPHASEAPQDAGDYGDEDPADSEMTAPIPRPVQESYDKMSGSGEETDETDDGSESDEAENPLFAPTRIVPKKPAPPAVSPKAPDEEAETPEATEASEEPEPAKPAVPAFNFSKPPAPKTKAKAVAKPAGFKLPPPPVSKPSPKAKVPAPPKPALPKPPQDDPNVAAPQSESSAEDLVVSSQLANMLGIRDHEPSIKDIVRQINCWPGMRGCIIGGKDGLRISSDVDDDSFANSISAFAPKLISRISELFNDLGFAEVEELHTPVQDSSVYIFRKNSLYLIILFEDASFPESYRNLVKRVLEELNNSKEINSA